MPTIPCYRCGHPIDFSPDGGPGPDVCPNCGHNFAVGKLLPPPLPGNGKGGAKSEMSTGTASGIAILLGIVTGVVKSLGSQGTGNISYDVGKGLGSGLVIMAISFVLAIIASTICLIFGKPFRRTLDRTYCLFAIILACLGLVGAFVGNITGRSTEKTKQAKQAAAELVKDADALREAVRISNETGKPIELDLAPVGDQSTEAGKIRLITHMNIKAMADLQNAYMKALEDAGFDTQLDPERLAKDKGMKESREILAKGKAVVQEYRGKFEEHLRTFPEKVKAMPDSPAQNAEWFKGFQHGLQKSGQAGLRIWDLESETVGKFGEIIDLLAASEGKWGVEEGQIMFEEDGDIEKFNAIIEKIQALGEEQEKIREEAYSKGKAQLENAVR